MKLNDFLGCQSFQRRIFFMSILPTWCTRLEHHKSQRTVTYWMVKFPTDTWHHKNYCLSLFSMCKYRSCQAITLCPKSNHQRHARRIHSCMDRTNTSHLSQRKWGNIFSQTIMLIQRQGHKFGQNKLNWVNGACCTNLIYIVSES